MVLLESTVSVPVAVSLSPSLSVSSKMS